MKLPNCERATVAQEKITGYLLALDHPDGGPKAAFFLRFGFAVLAWDELAETLRRHACANNVLAKTLTRHGEVYRVEGSIDTPDGRRPHIRSVWIVAHGSDTPTLVTAYSLRRRR